MSTTVGPTLIFQAVDLAGVLAWLAMPDDSTKPAKAGKHDIENQQFVDAGQGNMRTVKAVAHKINGKTCLLQALTQVITDFWLVLDHQNLHHTSLLICLSRCHTEP